MQNVVVTGLGFVTCLGNSRAAVVDHLRHLRHGMVAYPPFQNAKIPLNVAAPVPDFNLDAFDQEDWEFPDGVHLRLEQLRGLPPHGLYALFALKEAAASAGLSLTELSDPQTGLFTASGGSPDRIYRNLARMEKVGPLRCSPLGIISSVAGTLSFNLVAIQKIKGSSAGFVSACASSGHALGFAHDEIALGRQDRMVVVGAEDINANTILPFLSMRVLSQQQDPEKASRPFDRDRDGFVGTGGAVVMILENETVARERGARVLAEFAGWGHSTDGYHVAISHPEGEGLERAMRQALKVSGFAAGDIAYINAHATSTPIGDAAELRAIRKVFGSRDTLPISSTKALTGHALSLSSIMEAAFSVLSIDEGMIPGSAHIENLDSEADGLFIPRRTLTQQPDLVLSNSSGFGGANVSLVFKRPTA